MQLHVDIQGVALPRPQESSTLKGSFNHVIQIAECNALSNYAMVSVSKEDGIFVSDYSKDGKLQGNIVAP